MYKALIAFADSQDDMHLYNEGDIYPREGLNPSEERVKELLSTTNRSGKKAIREVPDEAPKAKPKSKPKTSKE